MTPEEALQILDAAAAEAPLNRISHVQVQRAAQSLAEFIRNANKSTPSSSETETGKPEKE